MFILVLMQSSLLTCTKSGEICHTRNHKDEQVQIMTLFICSCVVQTASIIQYFFNKTNTCFSRKTYSNIKTIRVQGQQQYKHKNKTIQRRNLSDNTNSIKKWQSDQVFRKSQHIFPYKATVRLSVPKELSYKNLYKKQVRQCVLILLMHSVLFIKRQSNYELAYSVTVKSFKIPKG